MNVFSQTFSPNASLVTQSKKRSDILTIEATVTTGFEFLAQDECREKCKPLSMTKAKGRIFFNIPASNFEKVLSLRSVDNIFLVTESLQELAFEGKKDTDLEIIKSLVDVVDWDVSLKKWAEITGFKGVIYPPKNKLTGNSERSDNIITDDEHKIPGTSELETVSNESQCKVNESKSMESSDVPCQEFISEYGPLVNVPDDKMHSNKTDLEKILDLNKCVALEDKISSAMQEVNISTEDNSEKIISPKLDADKWAESEIKNSLLKNNILLGISEANVETSEEGNVQCETTFQLNCKKEDETNLNLLNKEKIVENESVVHSSEIHFEETKNPSIPHIENESISSEKENVRTNESEFTSIGDDEVETTQVLDDKEINESTQKFEKETVQKSSAKSRHQQRNKQCGRSNRGKPGWRGSQRSNISKKSNNDANDGTLRFRATCYRVGGKHSFSSMEAACDFGGALQDKFRWTVDLTKFDLNVILNIEQSRGYISIALTQESLHRRNITHFNNTTLRATICYNLFRLAEPMNGEIVVDPLCGGGSIPIEGALSFPYTYNVCGDYNDKAMERTRANIQHINNTNTELKIGAVRWNIKKLPLRPQSVDILITDLPFGKRSGIKQDNQRLYKTVLFELAKVIKTGTGRACLLTYDKVSLIRALRSQNEYWREIRQFGVNQGGLFSTVFLLLRKATLVPERSNARCSVEEENIPKSTSIGVGNASSPEDDTLKPECKTTVLESNISLDEEKISTFTPDTMIESNPPTEDISLDEEKISTFTPENMIENNPSTEDILEKEKISIFTSDNMFESNPPVEDISLDEEKISTFTPDNLIKSNPPIEDISLDEEKISTFTPDNIIESNPPKESISLDKEKISTFTPKNMIGSNPSLEEKDKI